MPNSSSYADTWLLIPAFNVGNYLGDLLRQTLQHIPKGRTVVINDGSTDETSRIADAHGVTVINHSRNRGKGVALRTGFSYLQERSAEWCITIDGDLQHDPGLIPQFMLSSQSEDVNLIIGRRKRSGGMPWDRRFSNWSTSWLMSVVTGMKIYDAQSGYRMIKRDLFYNMKAQTEFYDFETECLLEWSGRGALAGWVDIPTTYNNAPSSIHHFKDTMRFLKVIIKYISHVR